jgi:hypothetical protein
MSRPFTIVLFVSRQPVPTQRLVPPPSSRKGIFPATKMATASVLRRYKAAVNKRASTQELMRSWCKWQTTGDLKFSENSESFRDFGGFNCAKWAAARVHVFCILLVHLRFLIDYATPPQRDLTPVLRRPVEPATQQRTLKLAFGWQCCQRTHQRGALPGVMACECRRLKSVWQVRATMQPFSVTSIGIPS